MQHIADVFWTHLSCSSLLALIIARDQFEETFVTIIRSLRLTFTFSVKKIYIGTFFGWCALFWFFVVWIKLLSNQIHISQVLESFRPISQMINIPFMPEILWDGTFFACLVCNYYYQTEGGDKCQYIVNPFFFCQSALVLVHQYIFRATLWNIRGTKKHSITLCGLLIGMSEIYQWSLRKIRYTLLFLIAQFLFQSIYQDSRSKLSKYFVPISMFTLSSLDFCTWKCWFWFFWRVGAGTWKAWQSSVSLKDIQYWFSYCPLLEYLGRHFTFNHKSSKWAHFKHRIW